MFMFTMFVCQFTNCPNLEFSECKFTLKNNNNKNTSVKQRTVDGGVSIATGLAFADLTEVSLDEVCAFLLFPRPHLGVLLHLAGNKPTNQVPDGQQLLRLERIAWEVLQNGNEVDNSCACRY